MTERKRGLFGLFKKPAETSDVVLVEGTATPEQREMRLRMVEFETARVADVMIPRAEIIGVEVGMSLDDLIQFYASEAHSRLPVYRDTLDDPIGVVHIRDVVGEIARLKAGAESVDEKPLERLRRDLLYVPASMPLTDLLVKMQASRMHLALVVDEYGGTDGLVSLEDLVEEIVGEIEDEHDEEVAMLVRRGRLAWEVDARMETGDFAQETGVVLDLDDHEVDTLGGVAFALAGRVPLRGESLPHPAGVDLEILESDARRIQRIIVRQPVEEAKTEDASDE
jgi:CBS domain containing-hemolysin-like protein